jgi:hypothetical protein
MPRMIISFEMDNAAFDDNACTETARILRNLADRMEEGINEVSKIYDANGNRIGQAEHYND